MGTPSSGTISIYDINSVFGRGTDLNSYRGTTWYTPGSITMGTFSSNAISLSDFYNKQANDPASSGSNTFSTPGTTSFTVPLFRNSLTIYVWGGGGGGGGYGNSPGSSYTDGTQYGGTGGTSVFYGPNTLTANGGVGGQTAGTPGAVTDGTGGAGGSASGGSINTSGTSGTNGFSGAIGGGSPNGGASTSYRSTQGSGDAGNATGGGGGGMVYSFGGKFPAAAGGGGGGGYTTITYSPGGITTGGVYTVVVGGGGAGGPNNLTGGNGANGQIYIVWN
jgi:hypothetical protein